MAKRWATFEELSAISTLEGTTKAAHEMRNAKII
jgi:hypothetical protein